MTANFDKTIRWSKFTYQYNNLFKLGLVVLECINYITIVGFK